MESSGFIVSSWTSIQSIMHGKKKWCHYKTDVWSLVDDRGFHDANGNHLSISKCRIEGYRSLGHRVKTSHCLLMPFYFDSCHHVYPGKNVHPVYYDWNSWTCTGGRSAGGGGAQQIRSIWNVCTQMMMGGGGGGHRTHMHLPHVTYKKQSATCFIFSLFVSFQKAGWWKPWKDLSHPSSRWPCTLPVMHWAWLPWTRPNVASDGSCRGYRTTGHVTGSSSSRWTLAFVAREVVMHYHFMDF